MMQMASWKPATLLRTLMKSGEYAYHSKTWMDFSALLHLTVSNLINAGIRLLLLAHLSRRLTRWAYSIPMFRRPSVVVRRPHFQTLISLKPDGQSWSKFMCSITGVGERLYKVSGQIGSKLVSMATESPHWLIMGKTMSPPFLVCFWSDPFYTCR